MFHNLCDDGAMSDDCVKTYLEVKDNFDRYWDGLVRDIKLKWFSSSPQRELLFNTLETHILFALNTKQKRGGVCCEWTGRNNSNLSCMGIVADPVATWYNMNPVEWFQHGGTLDEYLKSNSDPPMRHLWISSHLNTLLKACWNALNVTKLIDSNLWAQDQLNIAAMKTCLEWTVIQVDKHDCF